MYKIVAGRSFVTNTLLLRLPYFSSRHVIETRNLSVRLIIKRI